MKTIVHILKTAGGWRRGLHIRIENPPHLALVIKATDEPGPCGLRAVSVCQYDEQNGKAMCDPLIYFELGFAAGAYLNPFYFRSDFLGLEQWSRTIIPDYYVYLTTLHDQHERFADQWDKSLRIQGFVEAFERSPSRAKLSCSWNPSRTL